MENHPPKGDFEPVPTHEPGNNEPAIEMRIATARAEDCGTGRDDAAEVRANLLARMNATGVTSVGQAATIHTAEGVYGRDADHEDEPDTYDWRDAATWYAAGGEDELGGEPRLDSAVLGELFAREPLETLGSRDDMGWCGLVRHDDRPGGAILLENPYGRRSAWTTDSDEDLASEWQNLWDEREAYELARETADSDRGSTPAVWVGSLADYAAGYLHGAWLNATLTPEQLARAVQFVLRNSHEPGAEEYGIFDYDGFSSDLTSLLGEYPSLKMISRIAQGIEEHGPAYGAWAAYVGLDSHEQLDRFTDHYLGEWESLTAYAQDLLEESGAYRVLDQAPEWLRPYLGVDIAGYARDLECDLHVEERPDGGVWLFDTH